MAPSVQLLLLSDHAGTKFSLSPSEEDLQFNTTQFNVQLSLLIIKDDLHGQPVVPGTPGRKALTKTSDTDEVVSVSLERPPIPRRRKLPGPMMVTPAKAAETHGEATP